MRYYLLKAKKECEIWCLDKTDNPIPSCYIELSKEELDHIIWDSLDKKTILKIQRIQNGNLH